MKSPSYLLVWNKKSQELFQLSHQLLGWSNSKIWIVHLLSVKTWFTDTERGHHQDNVYPSIHCTKIVLHKIGSEIVGNYCVVRSDFLHIKKNLELKHITERRPLNTF